MTTAAPAVTLSGPPRVPTPFGLFSVLAFLPSAEGRWENGAVWEALTCEPLPDVLVYDCDPDIAQGFPKVFDASPGTGEAPAFTVYGTYHCSLTGNTADFAEEQATAHLLAREEQAVSAKVWASLLADSHHQDLGSFADAGSALAAVECANRLSYGSLGMLHVSCQALPLLAAAQLIAPYSTRNQLFDIYGTPIEVTDAPGSAMIGMTPALLGYRSDVFTPPSMMLDTSNNDLYGLAERTYLVGWDPCGTYTATIGGTTP